MKYHHEYCLKEKQRWRQLGCDHKASQSAQEAPPLAVQRVPDPLRAVPDQFRDASLPADRWARCVVDGGYYRGDWKALATMLWIFTGVKPSSASRMPWRSCSTESSPVCSWS